MYSHAILAAIPETFLLLFECLKLEKKDILLVRGAISALGYVSLITFLEAVVTVF